MLLRLCQLKSQLQIGIMLVLMAGCSFHSNRGPTPDEFVSVFPNKWFGTNPEHALVDSNGAAISHMLFDTTPEFNEKARTVNVVIATPKNSEHAYKVDVPSGQLYYSHSFCKQKDVWSQYTGTISKPSFSTAYIPRVLDQLGEPQKIIVFSNRKNYGETHATNYYKVKIMGAYVEQVCPEGNCLGKNNWSSRLVFVGVDNEDASLTNFKYAEDFKKVINWEETKAQVENLEGRNFIGDNTYPYIRAGQLIDFMDAFDYFKKRSIFLTDKELHKIQKGCQVLYDGLWNEVGVMQPEDKPAKTKEELNAKIKLIEGLKKKKQPVGFSGRLAAFTLRYYNEITTCEKFVYHGNLNKDREKFWFLSYMGLFYRLHREGYYFGCEQKTWLRNVADRDGKPVYNIKRDISKCTNRDIDMAMEYLPNFMNGLKGEKDYYKFIDYDNHTFGTHNKLYTWVKMRSRKLDCSNDPNEKIKKESKIFPEDTAWKTRDIKDLADELKIIY